MVLRIRSLKELGANIRGLTELKRTTRRRIPSGPSVPQARLWSLVKAEYPEAEAERKGLVPGRRYVVDIVIERLKLVVELDGWEFHGKHKAGFERDREKDRLLLLEGFRVVRFTAGEVLRDPMTVMETLARVVEMIQGERNETNEKVST